MDPHQRVFDSQVGSYERLGLELQRPETLLLREFRERDRVRMLDVGIGSGRTSYTFAPLADRYVGVDYVPQMVEAARNVVEEGETVQLRVADARGLSGEVEGPFDLILFSFNGLDAMSFEERFAVLGEIRGVIAEGGQFAFSSHSLNALPLTPPAFAPKARRPLRSAYAATRIALQRRKVARVNAELDLAAAREAGWAVVPDAGHDHRLHLVYVTPEFQLRQLEEAGFGEIEVYDRMARRVDPADAGADPWLHYFCRPAAG